MAGTEDATVEIVAEDASPVIVPAGGAQTSPQPSPSITETVDDLKSQMERSRQESARRLAEKDRIIAETLSRAQTTEKELIVTQKSAVEITIDRLKAEKDSAKRDLKAAHEAGDYDKVAEAQDKISLANARIVEAERGRVALEEQEKAPAPAGRQPVSQSERLTEMETYARQAEAQGSHKSAAWLRSHPEMEGKGRELGAAHDFAVARGAKIDSDQYFQLVEHALGLEAQRSNGGAVQLETRQEPAVTIEREKSPVAAPVRRDAMTTPSGRQEPGKIRLSAGEAKAAIETLSPLYPDKTEDELYRIYWKNKQELIRENHPNYDVR